MTLAGPEGVELEWSNYSASSCRQQSMAVFSPWAMASDASGYRGFMAQHGLPKAFTHSICIDLKHLSVHQWLRSAIPDSQQPSSPIGFLFLKLPPPPCAVLLVYNLIYIILYICNTVYIFIIYIYTCSSLS